MRRLALGVVVWLVVSVAGQIWALGAQPRNVIFFIGDGMGPEQVKAAGYFNGGPLSFESFPYQGRLTTHSADSSVTDSAAAGTALATGHKVNNGVISEARPANPDYPVAGSEMETLLEYYQARGKSTGLVTTTYLTSATPAAFGAHTSDRNNLIDIAIDYLYQTRPNVLFGGGGSGMSVPAATAAGYTVVTSRAAMQALDTETQTRVSGQFGGGDLPYEYDGLGALPHLSQMTSTALNILDNDPDGFFLMVEGGLIDYAGHANDIRRNVGETIEFANSVQQVIDWAAGRSDTLILVTADHETGGLRVLGPGPPGTYPPVTWGTGGHTSANVPVYAWGQGAELISGVMDNTYMFEVATALLSTTLTWDEKGPGGWEEHRWIGNPPPHAPDGTTHAVVRANMVTVAAGESALTLMVESGGVLIGSAAELTVGEGVEVAAGADLYVAGTLNAQSLTTAGTTTFAEGSVATVDTVNVTGGVTTLAGPKIRTINAVGGILDTAVDVTELNVDGGTVVTSADVTAENVSLTSGGIQLGENTRLYVATIEASGGILNTGTGHVVVGDTLKIGDNTAVSVTDGTLKANGFNLADPAEPSDLTLSGGRLSIAGGTGAPFGAIAIWRFNEFHEGEKITTPDSSYAGNDHLATPEGAEPVSDDPDHRTALSFEGSALVEAANTGDIEFGAPFTIGMWIKTMQKGGELVGKDNGDGTWGYFDKALYLDAEGGQVTFGGAWLGVLTGTTDVADGEWHHLAVTYNGSTSPGDQEIYVDGVNDTHPTGRRYIVGADPGDVFRLGSAETTELKGCQQYIGLMDDVYLYNRSLSPAEVADLYQALSSVVEPMPKTNLRVTAGSTLHLDTASHEAVLGNLMLEPGVALEVTGAALRVGDLTAGHGCSIQGDVGVSGTLSLSGNVGTLTLTGDVTMEAASIYRWELGAPGNDVVNVEGGRLLLETGWRLQLHALGGRAVGPDEHLYLFTFGEHGYLDGSSDLAMNWDGALELLGDDWDPGNASWNPTLQSNGTGVYATGVVAVPEPGTLALLTMATFALLAYSWGRRHRG